MIASIAKSDNLCRQEMGNHSIKVSDIILLWVQSNMCEAIHTCQEAINNYCVEQFLHIAVHNEKPLPLYCLHKTFMQQNKLISQFCAELQWFSTKGFR